jgi:predicted transcriptional regulator
MCGAVVTEDGADSLPDHTALEVIRKLAFIADTSPSIAILLIHTIAGRTEREIANKLGITHQAVHERIVSARKAILAIKRT